VRFVSAGHLDVRCVRTESRKTGDLRPTHSRQGFGDAALADRGFAAARQGLELRFEPLQIGDALPPAEPWASMENTGHW